ncbi:hypothetical protein DESC_700004 [Desulfosarcina cetonica]|nr:hypothetical protein DESC_700004 [Desulfosarcina cetonica]
MAFRWRARTNRTITGIDRRSIYGAASGIANALHKKYRRHDGALPHRAGVAIPLFPVFGQHAP